MMKKTTNDFNVRPKTEREIHLEDQLRSALSALRDLDRGHLWREMHIDVPSLLEQAKELGVELVDGGDD